MIILQCKCEDLVKKVIKGGRYIEEEEKKGEKKGQEGSKGLKLKNRNSRSLGEGKLFINRKKTSKFRVLLSSPMPMVGFCLLAN